MKPNLKDHQKAMLEAKLDKSVVRTRRGGGNTKLSYLEAHYVRRRMNFVFGFDGWSCETVENRIIREHQYESNKGGRSRKMREVINHAMVRVTVHTEHGDLVRDGTGIGNGEQQVYGDDSRNLDCYELAAKEAESDAFKRACMNFGDTFGLALYDKDQLNVAEDVKATEQEIDPDVMARIASAKSVDVLYGIVGGVPRSHAHLYIDACRAKKAEICGDEG